MNKMNAKSDGNNNNNIQQQSNKTNTAIINSLVDSSYCCVYKEVE